MKQAGQGISRASSPYAEVNANGRMDSSGDRMKRYPAVMRDAKHSIKWTDSLPPCGLFTPFHEINLVRGVIRTQRSRNQIRRRCPGPLDSLISPLHFTSIFSITSRYGVITTGMPPLAFLVMSQGLCVWL